jgi:hydroxymethylpyrimidine pyrophosphatase-like HAD family hydrolase
LDAASARFLKNAKNYEKKLKLFGRAPIIASNGAVV